MRLEHGITKQPAMNVMKNHLLESGRMEYNAQSVDGRIYHFSNAELQLRTLKII